MEENLLLRDSEIFPTAKVLENALGKECYDVYEELTKIITSAEFDLNPEWNFYKDGKAWLCKVIYKKKTLFWLSIWDKHFKTTFYFTDKTYHGVMELPIDEMIKQRFEQKTAIGKLIPLVLEIDKPEQLEDLKVIINYKKRLK
ncbi:MAG: DUF3788 family protein [Paludibacter sp.]